MKQLTYTLLLLALIATGCRKDEEDMANAPSTTPAQTFNFETSGAVEVTLNANPRLRGAFFELYTADPEAGGKLFAKGILDASGSFKGTYALATAQTHVFLKSKYIGLPGDINIPIHMGYAQYDFESVGKRATGKRSSGGSAPGPQLINNVVYNYMGTYNNQGVPDYLTTPDNVDQSLLADINAALPEGFPVPTYNTQYLASGNDVDVNLLELCDVWITFVHEGAGYRNVLGYYTYPTNNPPTTAADIDSIHFIFPNTSFAGSGGGLNSGDKVYLGRYTPGTSIGWVLVQNAWNGNAVNTGNQKFYSNPDFNPEPTAADRQHNVALYHTQRDLVLIGFEDIQRNFPACDQDFNDAIFYVSSNPVTAIDNGSLPTIGSTANNDQDNDGVDDNSDDYPNDPTRAFDNYYPFQGGFASVAFEDLWPSQGDYDFNDLVLRASYKHVTNASNFVVDCIYEIEVDHIGASFHNGFGFQFPFAPSDVSNVTGTNLTDNLITVTSNGLEANQTNAVVILFDDAFDNEGSTLNLTINLSTPYSFSALNQQGLNPFIFVNGERGREVHLPGQLPTDLANTSYFGQGADASDPTSGIYYKTTGNAPWALEINNSFSVPREKVRIENAYLRFDDWVQSSGSQYEDWYSNLGGGYRNTSNLYP